MNEKDELEPPKKKYAKYDCPPDVKELIDEVNLVPFPINMMSLDFEETHRTREMRQKTGDPNAGVSTREVLKDCLKDLPEEFQNHIKSVCYASWLRTIDLDKADWLEIHRMAQTYATFYRMHNETINYARRLQNERDGVIRPDAWDVYPISASGVILKDDEGKNYVKGLAGVIHKIIPDRFRMCEVCNHIFWAKRVDSKTCSTPCFNKLKQRNARRRKKSGE